MRVGIAVGEHDLVVIVQRIQEIEAGMPVMGQDSFRRSAADRIRRVAEAKGMRADGVAHICQSQSVQPRQKLAIINGVDAVVEAGRRKPGADDDRARIGGFDGGISAAQQVSVAVRADGVRRAVPLAAQIWLVPDFISLHAPGVARGKCADKGVVIGEIVGRAIFDLAGPRPIRGVGDGQQNIQIASLQSVDDGIKLR